MKHNYTDKNWRVTYFDKPFEERKTPQDFMPHEHKFNNYEDAEDKFLSFKNSHQAHNVMFQIWDEDCCINNVESKKEWSEYWEEKSPKVFKEMLRENIIDKMMGEIR